MLSLQVDVVIFGNIRSESVDSSSIIDGENQKRKIVLRSSIKDLCHTSILGPSLSNKYNTDAIVISRRSYIVLLNILIIRQTKLLINKDTLGCSSSIGELFSNECPSSLEVSVLVKNMHGSSSSLTGSSLLHHELSHDSTGINTTSKSVGVLTIIRILLISIFDSIINKTRNTLLSIIKMHESTDLSLHVSLVTCILESTSKIHGVVEFEESLLVCLQRIVRLSLFSSVSESFSKLWEAILFHKHE
jgi:hypothetical protein